MKPLLTCGCYNGLSSAEIKLNISDIMDIHGMKQAVEQWPQIVALFSVVNTA
jgi:hypothetical protein